MGQLLLVLIVTLAWCRATACEQFWWPCVNCFLNILPLFGLSRNICLLGDQKVLNNCMCSSTGFVTGSMKKFGHVMFSLSLKLMHAMSMMLAAKYDWEVMSVFLKPVVVFCFVCVHAHVSVWVWMGEGWGGRRGRWWCFFFFFHLKVWFFFHLNITILSFMYRSGLCVIHYMATMIIR